MDREKYLAEERKDLQRIKTRIIWLLISAATFVVLTILTQIMRPHTNILPVTLWGLGLSLVMAAVEYLSFRAQNKRVKQMEEELNTKETAASKE